MDAFAEMIDEGMRRKGWGYNRLSVEIGVLPGGGIFNPTQIRRLRFGERRNLSRELVARFIDVLDLPEAEAWHASGLWPPDLDLDGYRRFRTLTAVGTTSEQQGRTMGAWGARPAQRERRRRDRRALRLVPLPRAS